MRRKPHEFAKGALVKQKSGPSLWHGNRVLRIAKRKRTRWDFTARYFVVAVGDPYEHGAWLTGSQLRELNALEQLAAADMI